MRPLYLLLLWVLFLATSCDQPTQPAAESSGTPVSFDRDEDDDDEDDDDDDDDGGRVVHVAAPTGNPAIDVGSIQNAVAAAAPGAVIQLARGTYAIEATTRIVVSTPRVTLHGHHRGSTIRGVAQPASPDFLVGHFILNGGQQTVRGITFDGFGVAISFGEPAPAPRTGGYRLENSVFRNGDVAFETVTFSNRISTVRGNHFIDVTIPFFITGKTWHFTNNRNSNPNPSATPAGRPFNAGIVLPEFWSSIVSDGAIEVFPCERNRFEGNSVSRNADGFILDNCGNNVLRRNSFADMRLFPGNDELPTFDNGAMFAIFGPESRGNLIEGNSLRRSPGIGIILNSSNNRIVENEFRDVVPGPVPPILAVELGLDLGGTAILLGHEATGSRVCQNEFRRVEHRIVDLGTDNQICRKSDDDDDFAGLSAARLAAVAELGLEQNPKLQILRERMRR